MAKQIWSTTLIVTTDNGESRDPDFYYRHDDLVADGAEDARDKVFTWARKKLARFARRNGRDVHIHAGPRIKSEGRHMLDGTKMLRNRFKFGDIKGFMRKGNTAQKVFVIGYGPKQAEELAK